MSMLHPSRVLVPVEPSHIPHHVLDSVFGMVGPDAVVAILAVISPFESAKLFNWGTIADEPREAYALRDVRRRLAGFPYAEAPLHVVFGEVCPEIVRYARTIDADLIVLPAHQRTGLGRWLNSSVAERVIRRAHCPVLIVPIDPKPAPIRTEPRPILHDETPGHRGSW